MFVSAKEHVGLYSVIRVVDQNDQHLPLVFAANTDEGWYDQYIKRPDGKMQLEAIGKLATKRTYSPFKLINKNDGSIVAEVK
jgi:hypothetical protein